MFQLPFACSHFTEQSFASSLLFVHDETPLCENCADRQDNLPTSLLLVLVYSLHFYVSYKRSRLQRIGSAVVDAIWHQLYQYTVPYLRMKGCPETQ
ncbi:hypothetical protein D3C75_1099440 [compost metagenome]